MVKCHAVPCTNKATAISTYCVAHRVGSPWLNKVQKRKMCLYRFQKRMGQLPTLPIVPMPLLGPEPDADIGFLPDKKKRRVGDLYWHDGNKVVCKKGGKVKHACVHEGCKTNPNFGFPEDDRPTYCTTHKTNGMGDIKNKRCVCEGCKKQPAFGFPGERPTYCDTHKQDGMENIKRKRARVRRM